MLLGSQGKNHTHALAWKLQRRDNLEAENHMAREAYGKGVCTWCKHNYGNASWFNRTLHEWEFLLHMAGTYARCISSEKTGPTAGVRIDPSPQVRRWQQMGSNCTRPDLFFPDVLCILASKIITMAEVPDHRQNIHGYIQYYIS